MFQTNNTELKMLLRLRCYDDYSHSVCEEALGSVWPGDNVSAASGESRPPWSALGREGRRRRRWVPGEVAAGGSPREECWSPPGTGRRLTSGES